MNNVRRHHINAIISTLQDRLSQLETIRDEEQEAYDSMPDGLKESDRGQQAEQACSELDDACSNLESVIDSLENAKE